MHKAKRNGYHRVKNQGLKIAYGKIVGSSFLCFLLGALFVLLLLLPGFWLGEGSYVQMHDQLDGEVINYIYHAKYLGNAEIIPEFMNGAPGSAMTPPAPLFILFFRVLSPYWAFQWMYAFEVVLAFVGMDLLAKKLSGNRLFAAVTAVLFAYLPLYPVYGLSVYGQPLLLWALLGLVGGSSLWSILLSYLCIFVYAAGSSFALVGFVWVGVLFLAAAVMLMKKRDAGTYRLGVAFLMLLATYLLCNQTLVKDLLGLGDGVISHREEMTLASTGFAAQFRQLFFEGGAYVTAYGLLIALFLCYVIYQDARLNQVTVSAVNAKVQGQNTKLLTRSILLRLLLGIMVILVSFASWWKSGAVPIREWIGGMMKSFQFDRVYWLMPMLWYLCLALGLGMVPELRKKALESGKRMTAHSITSVMVIVLALQALIILRGSLLNINLRLLLVPGYERLTWEKYYGEDTYSAVEEYIEAQTGMDKAEYRCVSLGVDPACALYHGFYCLDGYSNFYPLEYKHRFRQIIATEIEKSDYLQFYFDEWGNRCYFFSSETVDDILIPRDSGRKIEHLEIDAKSLYDLGGRFVFSALPIENANESGLILMREEPFAEGNSNFEIWLYQVEP